ncbi:hypothetical protein O3301_19875 [Janthinobacterium sp. SUN211]|uniref:hypothetical protein n=1 Tax=Janthinobacterium sp. SUN211 TaxID=3014786 RepID=UPI00271223AD|nr:hypothetical protein [Janthinobacterium sp. SUN211]MDO8050725.1 hypothetical protein [Janthinobacterium sp. SUN211]
MNQQITVPVSKLDFDLQNPRYPVQNSDREALEKILLSSMPKSLKLAEHIVKYGQNPTDLIIVIENGTRYTVLEGNRRTSVLKVLSKPVLLDSMPTGAGVPAFCKRMKALATKANNSTVNKVTVVLFPSRIAADPWINLKHTGPNDGAGTVPWDSIAKSRYSNKGDIGLELLDFGKANNWFTDDDLKNSSGGPFPLSTLNRLLGDPQIRTALGLDLLNGVLLSRVSVDELAKGVKQVVADLSTAKWNVTKLKLKGDRKNYLQQFPAASLPQEAAGGAAAWQVDVESVPQPAPQEPTAPKPRQKSSTRKALIPKDFVITTSPKSPRLNRILAELKKMEVEKQENAVAVLFRTYIELTLDDYIARTSLKFAMSRPPQASLAEKAKGAAAHLKTLGLLDKNQSANVDRLVGINSDPKSEFGSITTLHSFVHSRHSNPIPSELQLAWDNIAPFMHLVGHVED